MLGSQVFDYWFDPSEFILASKNYKPLWSALFELTCLMQEHYADGDLVNCETKVTHIPAGPEALAVWGPPVPPVF